MKKGIYYIENTVDEKRSRITSYHATEDDAREALKKSSDWFRPEGTGMIYFQEFGIGGKRKLIAEV